MKSLAESLTHHHNEITERFHVNQAQWNSLTQRLEQQETKPLGELIDEQLWTFIIGCGYSISGNQGIATITKQLCGNVPHIPDNAKIWFEVMPTPPRINERGAHLDLALGSINLREGTESGIELSDENPTWICFCEMKWNSDISTHVMHDAHRNQLARVIENVLCFQKSGHYSDMVYVTVVTPKSFRDTNVYSRLYQYKFRDYNSGVAHIANDLDNCTMQKRIQPRWKYPSNIAERISKLKLNWATYDELIENLPYSDIQEQIKEFWNKYGNYQDRV